MKKIYSVLIVLLMAAMSVNTLHAQSSIYDRGDGWAINMDGILYIDKANVCKDYSSADKTPWYSHRNQIKEVWISGYFTIGTHMFEGYKYLTYVGIYNDDDEGSYDIHAYAFKDCPVFEGGTFNACHSIGESAFENCVKMQIMPLGGNIKRIGKNAFKGCKDLNFVYVGRSFITIEESAFEGCSKLNKFDLSYVRKVEQKAFKGCPLGGTVDLSSIETIGDYAFQNCQLSSVRLGADVTSLGSYAFASGIVDGGDLYIESTNPPQLASWTFSNVNYNKVTLHVPSEAKANYSSYPWSDFIPADRESQIYGIWDNATNTLILYYGDPYTIDDENLSIKWEESEAYHNWATKIIIDQSVAMATRTNMMNMFSYFKNVTKIEGLKYLNTSKATTMKYMFNGCGALESIDAEFLNTSEATDLTGMFANCKKLKSIDVSNFDMSKVTTTNSMFYGCLELETIYCSKDWTKMSNITDSKYMFTNCSILEGGHGTDLNTGHLDLSYARPDGGIYTPGYFSKKEGEAHTPLLCTEMGGNGSYDDVVHYQLVTNLYESTGGMLMIFSTNPSSYYDPDGYGVLLVDTREDGYLFVITIDPSSLEDLTGTYEPLSMIYITENGVCRMVACTEASAIISVDEESESYTLVLNLTTEEGEHFDGVLYNLCADVLPPQPVEKMESQKAEIPTTKILRDGHLYLQYNGKTFTATGAEVK